MAGRLDGKVAVITGAGSGMGRSIAEVFATEGARVLCADISGKQDEVARSIGKAAIGMHVDVGQKEDVRRMIAGAEEHFGCVDIVCNNAGTASPVGPVHETDDAVIERMIDINFKGVIYGIRYGVLSMLKTGGGSIINISSASGIVGWQGLAVYAGTKGAVVQLGKSAALDYAEQNIRVNTICPGKVWTAMAQNQLSTGTDTRMPPAGDRLEDVPLKRWGLDTEIAKAALFLASDDSSYVTGLVMPVDGGYVVG